MTPEPLHWRDLYGNAKIPPSMLQPTNERPWPQAKVLVTRFNAEGRVQWYEWWFTSCVFPVAMDYGPVRQLLSSEVRVVYVPILPGTPEKFLPHVLKAQSEAWQNAEELGRVAAGLRRGTNRRGAA